MSERGVSAVKEVSRGEAQQALRDDDHRASVEVRGLSVHYGADNEVLALQDLDLRLWRGEFAALVGPSGCGKSTLLKVVAGLRHPTKGTVAVDGCEVTGPLKTVGMAFQNPTLLPWRTTLENLLLPFEVVRPHRSRLRRQRAEYEARARELLSRVGLLGSEDRYPWQLSGGMQQRASLCRALIHEPDLLLLDEPFGALDAFTRADLWEVLEALWIDRKCTVLLVTHDLTEAVFLADTVHIVSSRPGHITESRSVPLARRRDRYGSEFVAIERALHECLGQARGAAS